MKTTATIQVIYRFFILFLNNCTQRFWDHFLLHWKCLLFECAISVPADTTKTGMIKLKRFLGKYFDIFNSTSSTRGQNFKISIFQLKLLSNPITIFLKTTDHCVFLSIHMHPYHLSLVHYRTPQFGNKTLTMKPSCTSKTQCVNAS